MDNKLTPKDWYPIFKRLLTISVSSIFGGLVVGQFTEIVGAVIAFTGLFALIINFILIAIFGHCARCGWLFTISELSELDACPHCSYPMDLPPDERIEEEKADKKADPKVWASLYFMLTRNVFNILNSLNIFLIIFIKPLGLIFLLILLVFSFVLDHINRRRWRCPNCAERFKPLKNRDNLLKIDVCPHCGESLDYPGVNTYGKPAAEGCL